MLPQTKFELTEIFKQHWISSEFLPRIFLLHNRQDAPFASESSAQGVAMGTCPGNRRWGYTHQFIRSDSGTPFSLSDILSWPLCASPRATWSCALCHRSSRVGSSEHSPAFSLPGSAFPLLLPAQFISTLGGYRCYILLGIKGCLSPKVCL